MPTKGCVASVLMPIAATIPVQQFGNATTSTFNPYGVMGLNLGYQINTNYYTIIDSLYQKNIIQSRAFSLSLGGQGATQGMEVILPTNPCSNSLGSIVFGGMDTKKYIEALGKSPIIPKASAPQNYPRYICHFKIWDLSDV